MVDKNKMLDQIDTYDKSIQALVAVRQHFEYEFKAKSFFGRKLKTSSTNPKPHFLVELPKNIYAPFETFARLVLSITKNHKSFDKLLNHQSQ